MQSGREGVMLPTYQILEPLDISGTVKDGNFKFVTHIDNEGH